MKIKIIALLLIVAFAVSCLASCGLQESIIDVNASNSNRNNEDVFDDSSLNDDVAENNNVYASGNDNASKNIVSTDNASGGKNVVVKSDSSLTPITLASSNTAKYKIVSFFANNTNVTDFASDLKTKTGATFTVSTDTSSIGGKQIVIGYSSKIKPYVGDFAFKSYTGGAAAVVGETVYISTASLDVLPLILDFFIKKIKVSGSTYKIASDLKIATDICAISENIPFFTTAGTASSPTDKGLYSAGGGNYQKTYKNLHAVDVHNYNNALISAGYQLKQTNTINSNTFRLYVKGDTMVHINWFAKLGQYSIIYGPKTYVPASAPVTDYKKLVTPSITQMALYKTGQSNVVQLEDGSFVVIDGGRVKGSSETKNKDSEILWTFLTSKKPASHAKPRIVWMFTHIHTDHIALARTFIPAHKNDIDLELVCWNFPDFNTLDKYVPAAGWKESNVQSAYATSVGTLYTMMENNFPNTPIYTFHTGEKLYLPGCDIEFLMTPEDYYLNGFSWINDTSCAWRISIQGRTFMVFGDCTAVVNDQMVACFGNYIKSDIIQVTHHGVGGATLSSVRYVDADICLWAVKEKIFKEDSRATTGDAHVWLRANSGTSGQRTRKHYTQDYTTTIKIPSMAVTSTRVYEYSDTARG